MDLSLLLLATVCLPLLGVGLIWVLAPLGSSAIRWGALSVTVATFLLAAWVTLQFDPEQPLQTQWDGYWLVQPMADGGGGWQLDAAFSVGLDGLSVWMFALSALLMVTAVLVSWKAIDDRPALFYGMLLLLEFGCLGVFTARDMILFYVFFEFTLIPLFFLIGIWGSEQRRYAAIKFFLYTLAGSLLTFLGLLALVIWNGYDQATGSLTLNFSIAEVTTGLQAAANIQQGIPLNIQIVIFLALMAGFAIKVPLFPVHTWLPLAHVQAPTAGSVILAGILLKIGVYGFLRFSVPMLPEATVACMPYVLWLSVIGIVYGALVALAQTDIKRLIAYSSVSHLGYCMLGIFALNQVGMVGGTLQMVNHGLSTGGLFAVVGMLYERYHTREIAALGGLARRTPWLTFFMVVFTLSSIGLPGLNGFVGEFLVLLAMFQRAWHEPLTAWTGQLRCISVLAVSGVVFGAWYMLWLVQRVFFGPLKEPDEAVHHGVKDLGLREIAALAPLVVFMVWIGVAPGFFLQRMEPAISDVRKAVETAVVRQAALDPQPAPPPAVTRQDPASRPLTAPTAVEGRFSRAR